VQLPHRGNDFPSQHRGEGHIILSHDRRYLNASRDVESRQVVAVQIRLSEKVLQALVVGEDMSRIPQKIMPPRTQSMNHTGQLKIMREIVLFMRAQLM
jgi:hypothetical protein